MSCQKRWRLQFSVNKVVMNAPPVVFDHSNGLPNAATSHDFQS